MPELGRDEDRIFEYDLISVYIDVDMLTLGLGQLRINRRGILRSGSVRILRQ
jgi:hypothetical protein